LWKFFHNWGRAIFLSKSIGFNPTPRSLIVSKIFSALLTSVEIWIKTTLFAKQKALRHAYAAGRAAFAESWTKPCGNTETLRFSLVYREFRQARAQARC